MNNIILMIWSEGLCRLCSLIRRNFAELQVRWFMFTGWQKSNQSIQVKPYGPDTIIHIKRLDVNICNFKVKRKAISVAAFYQKVICKWKTRDMSRN